MERTEFKTKDGRYLYKVSCPKCGTNRGLQPKKTANTLCRSCSAIEYRIRIPQNRTAESYLPNDKLKLQHPNVIFDDVRQFSCGVNKYRTNCIECGKDRGYQALNYSKKVCRACYLITNASKIPAAHKRIKSSMRSNLYHRLSDRDIIKTSGTFKILGYSVEALVIRLESLFTPGMTWDNYGEWHIDHKVPDSWFTYSSVEDQGFKDSWALSNLQPLWAKDNLKKSNKYSN